MAGAKTDALYGTLVLMVLKTLAGRCTATASRRIEQISGDALNQGTLSPALLRIEQEGWIRPRGTSPRRAGA